MVRLKWKTGLILTLSDSFYVSPLSESTEVAFYILQINPALNYISHTPQYSIVGNILQGFQNKPTGIVRFTAGYFV
jgi:hypothetical protein